MANSSDYKYLLGDSQREAARLQAQSKLWDPVSTALFDRLGVAPGWRVLEIGPGQGSLHLTLRRRIHGAADAVERSHVFAAHLRELCERDGLGQGQLWETDLRDAPLPENTYDLIFARWVFLFLPEPEAHLRKLVRALKPGGHLALQDYHRETLALIPRPEHWLDFMAADRLFFASQGGDASIGARLPELYHKVGLQLQETLPTIQFGRPGSAVWSWVTEYFLGVMDRYAAFSPFNQPSADQLRKHWLAAARNPAALIIAPTLLDVVGRKKIRRR